MSTCLRDAAKLTQEKILNRGMGRLFAAICEDQPFLIVLAAGKGIRFGDAPKCAQRVGGLPLARHSISSFQSLWPGPAVCVVGYRHDKVVAALGDDNIYVLSENPAGGTAFATYEAFSLAELERSDPVLFVGMGDRIIPAAIFKKLFDTHSSGDHEADLTFLTAIYESPKNRGKGRVIRDSTGKVLGILEQRDIDALEDERLRWPLDALEEGNCPLYAIRARKLRRYLEPLHNSNAQQQYYITDIIELIRRDGGEIRTITTTVDNPDYDMLCSDVTRPEDLALLEGILLPSTAYPRASSVDEAARAVWKGRPPGQVASIASQLEELLKTAADSAFGFKEDQPVAIGIAGGRLRIAFMHPDMGRFLGPAWQMPIGARDARGREQIVILVQSSDDRRIHLYPTNPEFREKVVSVDSDSDYMYPGDEVGDWYSYECFGTRMAERLLLSLGYFTDEELRRRKDIGLPLPPASLWISTSMRRPFSLVSNSIASLRTVRSGNLGGRIQAALGRGGFRGLRILTTGDIPRGGFSSSSAVTVAIKNALNALFDLGISPELLVHLSCQAEYGTGVRAGSLDQATEQKGRAGEGTLISSNPRDNYRILGTYPVPAERFHVLFPYSVDRDREAWKWSAGSYEPESQRGKQTTGEMRKMTGKAAELAAILMRLPLDRDFFKEVEDDLLRLGELGAARRCWVRDVLKQLPLLTPREELRQRALDCRSWYAGQLREAENLDAATAGEKADATIASLFAGWRDPVLRRTPPNGQNVEEEGVPLRAMVAYLFGEVAKNFYLIHHPDQWIECVARSQRGDCCFDIDPEQLPDREKMMSTMEWERDFSGPQLMERWLERFGARPFDYNRGLDDETLSAEPPPELRLLEGSNFFRGLALIDLAEAMLRRAFGRDAVALRVNAAGQGDFFQVHVDTAKIRVEDVKQFLRIAFYRRFGLSPEREFVEVHPGGGAVGIRLERYDHLPALIRALRHGLQPILEFNL